MRAVYWSAAAGQCGAASGMVAAGMAAAVCCKKKVFLMQTKSAAGSLEDMLLPGRSVREELEGVGMKAACRGIKSGTLTKDMFHNCIVEIPGLTISFLPGKVPESMTEGEKKEIFWELGSLAKDEFDLVLLKAEAGRAGLSQELLAEADRAVICLNQNRRVLSEYFTEESAIKRCCSGKELYLLGNYDPASDYTLRNLRKEFSGMRDAACVLPYCAAFRDASSSGEVPRFFLQNAGAKPGEPNYEFISQSKRLASEIMSGGMKHG